MTPPLRTALRAWTWLRRFRHRRGYGIHSPFAFQLVTGVVYEKGEYYAYRELAEARKHMPQALPERDDRLMLRLINHHRARTCVVAGRRTELTCRYLKAGRAGCRLRTLEEATPAALAGLLEETGGTEMLCILGCPDWLELFRAALPRCTSRTLVVAEGIHRWRGQSWKEVEDTPEVRVAFDLHDLGLAYFHRHLCKQNYLVSY